MTAKAQTMEPLAFAKRVREFEEPRNGKSPAPRCKPHQGAWIISDGRSRAGDESALPSVKLARRGRGGWPPFKVDELLSSFKLSAERWA